MEERDKEDVIVGNAINTSKKALATLKELFYDRPSYTKGDPYETAYKEGQRDVIGYIVGCSELAKIKGEQNA